MTSTFYFVGGEDHDFTKNGNCTVDTATTAARRTANARCSLKVTMSNVTDSWNGTFSTPQSTFWLTARCYFSVAGSSNNPEILTLTDAGGVRRLSVRLAAAAWSLAKRSAASVVTTLASTATAPPSTVLAKLDLFVNYGTSGTIILYVDGTQVLSYTGDVTTDGATSIAGFALGAPNTSNGTGNWSEVICCDSDTRSMSLVTLAPTANGNAYTFDSGSVASINEVTLDDATLASSGTAGQLAQFTVNASGITGNPAIKAVCVTARAAKGGTGPQNAKLNVRTNGVDYLSGAIALPAALNRIQGVFTSNPGTSGPWAYTDLTAAGFNVGIDSEA